jgi:uncharacterized membrane protein
LVIGLATVEATLRALWLCIEGAFPSIGTPEHQDGKEQVRLRLGRWLAVALEFELAADVLRTAVETKSANSPQSSCCGPC